MKRLLAVFAAAALVGLVLSVAPMVAGAGTQSPHRLSKPDEDKLGPYCSRPYSLCTEPKEPIGPNGQYTGHDEPAVLFYSNTRGSGNNNTYQVKLPKEPPALPTQDGTGGTWSFQLHPAFWFGMALCATQSDPNYTDTCTPDTDANIFNDDDPLSPKYIGHHPGTAFLELQFYPPGWVPQFTGPSCDATHWCAALVIWSFSDNANTGEVNNDDCLNNYFLVGIEPGNFAYVTKNGVSQAPANPLSLSTDPNLVGVTPDPSKDLFMNSGDQVSIKIHDSAAGLQINLNDHTLGQSGSMTASTANGFGQIVFDPNATQCSETPYAFHPMYATSSPNTRVPWAAHSYSVAYSDEIGHFEYCSDVTPDYTCTSGVSDSNHFDDDDYGCFPGSYSALVQIGGCLGSDGDFDGPPYLNVWPGTNANASQDHQYHTTPILFTSPTFNGGQQYSQVAFETDLPRIEDSTNPPCRRHTTGQGCVNPPKGAQFYPIYTTRPYGTGCWWQEGGALIPGTTNTFGGTSTTEFGTTLLQLFYPDVGGVSRIYEDFRNILPNNPCLAP